MTALERIAVALERANTQREHELAALTKLSIDVHRIADSFYLPEAADLDIVLGTASPKPVKGSEIMSNKKGTGSPVSIKMTQRGASAKGAIMTPQTLTAVPSSITLQPVDVSGNPVKIAPTDSVNGTLASDSASFAVAAGADSLHYTATIPPNTPQGTVASLSATLNGTIQGAPANLTASIQLTLNIPPVPVAVDLDIIIG